MTRIQPVLLFILIVCSISASSQEDKADRALKLYTNFDFTPQYFYPESENTDGISRIIYEEEINGFNFSPAFAFYNKNGNFSELEISRIRFGSDFTKEYNYEDSTGRIINVLSEGSVKEFEFFLRYEYNVKLFKNKHWKNLSTSLGFSATPFFTWSKRIPSTSNEFMTSTTSVGLYLSVIPGIEYRLGEKWFIDFDVPLAVVTSRYTLFTVDNPVIPQHERTQGTIGFYNGPVGVAIRLGVGFRM